MCQCSDRRTLLKLAQDIFVKLWINRQSINLQKPFNAYIYTICPDYIGTLSDPRVLLYAYRLGIQVGILRRR